MQTAGGDAATGSTAYRAGQVVRQGLSTASDVARDLNPLNALGAVADKVGDIMRPQISGFARGLAGIPQPARRDPNVPVLATVTPATAANASAINPPKPSFNGVLGGVDTTSERPAPTGTPALSDSGRPLGYGSTINGVRVFSDGSGGPGAPPATMTQRQIDALSQGGRLTIANAGAGGNIDSEAFAGSRPSPSSGLLGNTPQLGSAAGYALTKPVPSAEAINAGLAKLDRDTNYAKSDAAAIIGKDPRSYLGTLARNAEVEGESIGGAAGRAFTAAATNRLLASQQGPEDNRARGDIVAQQEAGSNEREGLNAQTSLEKALVDQPAGSLVTLADGTLAQVGRNGIAQRVTDASGAALRPQPKKQPIDSAAYEKRLSENVSRLLGLDPTTGLIPDPQNPGKFRQATAAELFRASTRGRELTNHDFGLDQPLDQPGGRKPVPEYIDANGTRAVRINGQFVPIGG